MLEGVRSYTELICNSSNYMFVRLNVRQGYDCLNLHCWEQHPIQFNKFGGLLKNPEQFHFCGKERFEEKPYCLNHCAIAYIIPEKEEVEQQQVVNSRIK